MVSGYKKSELLNFLGIKDSRRHIRICIRCGCDNVERKQNIVECRKCGKVLTTRYI